jgi:hypothetical protein
MIRYYHSKHVAASSQKSAHGDASLYNRRAVDNERDADADGLGERFIKYCMYLLRLCNNHGIFIQGLTGKLLFFPVRVRLCS